jgi:hypothetical protein
MGREERHFGSKERQGFLVVEQSRGLALYSVGGWRTQQTYGGVPRIGHQKHRIM